MQCALFERLPEFVTVKILDANTFGKIPLGSLFCAL